MSKLKCDSLFLCSPRPGRDGFSGAETPGSKRRMYSAVPGRHYVVVKSYQPQAEGEIALFKNDRVKGMPQAPNGWIDESFISHPWWCVFLGVFLLWDFVAPLKCRAYQPVFRPAPEGHLCCHTCSFVCFQHPGCSCVIAKLVVVFMCLYIYVSWWWVCWCWCWCWW